MLKTTQQKQFPQKETKQHMQCVSTSTNGPPTRQVDEDGFTKVISGITRTPDGLTIRGAPRPKIKTGAFAEALTTGSSSGATMGGKKKKKNKDRVARSEVGIGMYML